MFKRNSGDMTRRAAAVLATFLALIHGASAASAQDAGAASDVGRGGSAAVRELSAAPAYRNPGLAAGLSLTPMPVDFGNLYAGNVGWGIAYTSLELGLMAPMLFIASNHGMGHYGSANPWTSSDRTWMIGLVSGYVVVKVVSALHAAHAAEVFNRGQQARFSAGIVPSVGGGVAIAALRF